MNPWYSGQQPCSCVVSQKILSQRAIDDLQCWESDQGTPLSGSWNYNNSRAVFLIKFGLLIRRLTNRCALNLELSRRESFLRRLSITWVQRTLEIFFSSVLVVRRFKTAGGGRLEIGNYRSKSVVKTRNRAGTQTSTYSEGI